MALEAFIFAQDPDGELAMSYLVPSELGELPECYDMAGRPLYLRDEEGTGKVYALDDIIEDENGEGFDYMGIEIGKVAEGERFTEPVFDGEESTAGVLVVRNIGISCVDQSFGRHRSWLEARGAEVPEKVLFSRN